MAIGKRAIFFTMLSVVIVVAMIAFFMPNYDTYSYMSRVPTLNTRFAKANNFVSDIYGKVGERVLVFSSYNALRSLNNYLNGSSNPPPLSNISANFTKAVLNGTIAGVNVALMDGNTIPEMLAELNQLARNELGLRSNISVVGIEIFQNNDTGFDKIGLMMNVSLYLNASIATWNITKPIYTLIEIERLNDPYYIMNFNYENRVRFTNITNWTTATLVDVNDHIYNMRYKYEPDAPTFLMRFENKTENSTCCGMESLINPVELGIASKNYNITYVDYCFFNTTKRESCGDPDYGLYNFTQLSRDFPGFKLEIYHMGEYNISKYMNQKIQ